MSLLILEKHQREVKIAEEILERSYGPDPTHSEKAQREMPLDGLIQTIILLDLSLRLKDTDFFSWTGQWTYILMARRMPPALAQRTAAFLTDFLTRLKDQLWWLEEPEQQQLARDMLDAAVAAVQATPYEGTGADYIAAGSHEALKRDYFDRLLKRDLAGAGRCIAAARDSMPLAEVYTDIIQGVMYQVGEEWLHNRITVAQEHYVTAATQMVLTEFYPQLLERPKNGRRVIIACIGSELHELGARMVSDLFEDAGWDSIFLGAAVPEEALLATIGAEKPEVCALSVALQQGVAECAALVAKIRKSYPQVMIAVGGHAFVNLTSAADFVGADFLSTSVTELLEQLG
jgi:methanogenic corrinoid protein MtbC1